MSSVAAAPDDFVPPAYAWTPPRFSSGGQDAVDLAAAAGLVLDPWQAWALDQVLGENEDGSLVAFEAGLIVARQNGKGSCLEALVLNWLFLEQVELVLWSAHEFKTAAEGFRRMRVLLQGAPDLWPLVGRITTSNGDEGIELTTGQRLKFVARSKSSGKGFTGDKVILDEAYDLDGDQIAALIPTLATRPDPQVVYTSSAGMPDSHVLREVRDRGRAGGDPSLCWLEWCATPSGKDENGRDVYDMDDRDQWRAANPSMGVRISEEFIARERRSMLSVPARFRRERLGVWDEPEELTKKVRAEDWRAVAADADQESLSSAPRFFITIGAAGDACIAVASDRIPVEGVLDAEQDVRPHVELADHRDGSGWLARCLEGLAEDFPNAVFGAGKSGPVAGMVEAGLPVEVELLGPAEMAQACAHHEKLSRDRAYTHAPDRTLDISLSGAVPKPAGDGLWLWDWRASNSLAPIAAVTGALWLLEKHREDDYDLLDSFG